MCRVSTPTPNNAQVPLLPLTPERPLPPTPTTHTTLLRNKKQIPRHDFDNFVWKIRQNFLNFVVRTFALPTSVVNLIVQAAPPSNGKWFQPVGIPATQGGLPT